MYGTKARIGMLIPSANTIIEEEFSAMKPEGVSVHAARMFITTATIGAFERMLQDLEGAARLIATLRPSIVAFVCTMGSLFRGIGWDEKIINIIGDIVKAPTTTTATAVIRAFRKLGIHKISLGTPYSNELNEIIVRFIEDSGIRVVSAKAFDLSGEDKSMLSLERISALAREVDNSAAEAVFLSCNNLKSLPIVDSLERELGKFVLSSNIAIFWDLLRMLGIRNSIKGVGRLLETL